MDCNEDKKYLLVAHHVDKDHSNNDLANIEILCFNCHAKRHLGKIDEEWMYSTRFLTPRELIGKL